jgi:hypothetical protein
MQGDHLVFRCRTECSKLMMRQTLFSPPCPRPSLPADGGTKTSLEMIKRAHRQQLSHRVFSWTLGPDHQQTRTTSYTMYPPSISPPAAAAAAAAHHHLYRQPGAAASNPVPWRLLLLLCSTQSCCHRGWHVPPLLHACPQQLLLVVRHQRDSPVCCHFLHQMCC